MIKLINKFFEYMFLKLFKKQIEQINDNIKNWAMVIEGANKELNHYRKIDVTSREMHYRKFEQYLDLQTKIMQEFFTLERKSLSDFQKEDKPVNEQLLRKCIKCNKVKQIDEMKKGSASCKDCVNKYKKLWREKQKSSNLRVNETKREEI